MTLKEKALGFMLSTSCNLNCKLCTASIPQFKERGIHIFERADNYRRELEEIFRIYGHIDTISLSGGEPLLNPELPKIVGISLRDFSQHFNQFRIITNGCVLPSQPLLHELKTYSQDNADFQIDDYGIHSAKTPEIEALLAENHIPYHIKIYHGEEQYCGGWIDLGPANENREYSEAEAQHLVDHCRNAHMKCLIVFDGKLFLCPRAITGYALNFFDAGPHDYIDLLGETQSLAEKKRIAVEFGERPIQACYYCNGYDPENSPRFSAGEQV